WSSDVCSSDLVHSPRRGLHAQDVNGRRAVHVAGDLAPLDRDEPPQVHAGAVQGVAHDAAGDKVALAVPVDVRAVGPSLGGRVDKALVALDNLFQQVQGLAGVDGNLRCLLLSGRPLAARPYAARPSRKAMSVLMPLSIR